MQYEVFIPNDITMFNSIMNSVEPRLHHNFMQIRTLEKMRDTLLPKLMSGEVRVKINEQIEKSE
jgi:type I restriction enzyme S subunit